MRRIWALLAVALVIGGAFAWFTRSSDDDHVRVQLTRLASSLHKTPESNLVLRAAKLRGEFDEIFDESPHVTIPDLPTSLPDDRRALADAATELTSFAQELDLDLSELEIKVDDAHASAQVNATVTLKTDSRRATRPVTFLLWKRGGTWRVSAVTVWAADGSGR